VAWTAVKLPGAHCIRRYCVACGGITTKIKGVRKSKTMPKGLYNHRMLVKEADGLWRQIIHNKAVNGCCARCGEPSQSLQAAHNIGRTNHHTRWEPSNGLPCCSFCHMMIDDDAEEKRSLFLRSIGEQEYERLQLMKRARGKTDMHLAICALRQYIGRA
jgi:hypothetical protein